jgi:hypothetical protein
MKKFEFKDNQEKILISVGCSHTQGSAFVKNITRDGIYELASDMLKEKYGEEYVTSEYISKNFTWGGKLASLFDVDKFFNFGLGGMGIDACIRSIKNYCLKTKDISNTLFVFQIPNPIRKEILFNKGDKIIRTQIKNLQNENNIPNSKEYLTTFFDFDVTEIESFSDIFFIQRYLEARGAGIRMLVQPFQTNNVHKIQQIERYNSTFDNFLRTSFHSDLVKNIDFSIIHNSINFIDLRKLPDYVSRPTTLHGDGTRPGDGHANAEYNQGLGKCIFDNLNNKLPKKIFN